MSAAPLALRVLARRNLATAAAHPPPSATASTSTARVAPIPLANVEAQWAKLNAEEQFSVHRQLEEIQKKDWKTLSMAEKKAGTFSFTTYLLERPRDEANVPFDVC